MDKKMLQGERGSNLSGDETKRRGIPNEFTGTILRCWLPSVNKRRQAGQLSDREVLTIMIHFHQSQYRTNRPSIAFNSPIWRI